MQLIVLGMHRSGTSTVARLLNMMGAYFAPERMELPATDANPKGYWERRDIINLNEDIFTALGITWDNISQFKPTDMTSDIQTRFESLAREIILGLDANRPWMIKDPRLCLLLPFWQPLLEVPVCVYVHRNPIQVAQSLKKRENFSLMLGIALWEKYTLHSLANCAELPKILVHHHELMSNPVATVKKLYQDLLDGEVQGLRLPSDKEIQAFIDPKLFQQRGDSQLQNAYLNHQQTSLVDAFEQGRIFELEPLPQLSEGAAEILQEYENQLVARQEAIILQQQIGQRDQQVIQRDQQIAQRNDEIAQLSEEMALCSQEIDQRVKEITELQKNWQDVKQALQAEKAQTAQYQNQLRVAETEAKNFQQELRELSAQKQQLQTQLQTTQQSGHQTQTTLADQEHAILVHSQQAEQLQQQNHQLMHWLAAFDEDMKAVFNSLTWRSGNVFTKIALKLLFKKAGPTAQDHIKEMTAELAAWRRLSQANLPAPNGATASVQNEPLAKTTTTLSPSPAFLQHDPRDYSRWIQNYDTLTNKTIKRMQQRIKEWNQHPLISIVMPTYNTDQKWLRAALDSVLEQIYPHWELCVADDASTQPHVRSLLEEYAGREPRIKLAFRTENGHISAASNTALEMVTGEFVTFLDHDDMLAPHALFWVTKDILDYPDVMLWYSDEDKINEKGERHQPYFKSDWNPDLFLSHNLITHLAVYRTSLAQHLSGFREGYEGAQDYDFALRAIAQISPIQIRHIPRVLYHWRTIVGSTALLPDEKPYAIIAAQKAISEYLDRRNIDATVMESPNISGTIRVQYPLPVHLPLVTLIIPTRNGLELLRRCIESIHNLTDYEHFEILIINNQSDDSATLDYMQQLEEQDKARIIDYPHPFNYADMNNMAVEHAQGELIGLLNNDLEVINREWLSEMVSHALRPEIGIVGARLWYPDDTLQHGGVILGIGGVAGHSHKGLPRGHGEAGYFGRAGLIQNFSAVTGACMIMRKTNFLAVGGLNADNLSTAFNDVDLCLKMNEHNLRILWTPYAELYHHESASRGYEDTPEKLARFEKERAYMKSRWPNFLQLDPAYSPNLTLETQDFAYSWPPRISALP